MLSVCSRSFHTIFVLILQVMHSQRLSEAPLSPWIIIQPDGKVLAAHCNCMAGLGESCTHVAALLFSIEATVKVRESQTVTDEKSYWLPASVKGVSYGALKDIDFTSAKTKKRKLDNSLPVTPVALRGRSNLRVVDEPTELEFSNFLRDLSATGSKLALLAVRKPFQKDYVPIPLCPKFPVVLQELYDSTLLTASFSEIMKKCESVKIEVTQQETDAVESSTKTQASSKLWQRFRSGRITASRMHSVCHSSPSQPSQSLVLSVCYPENSTFKTAATSWGCRHEQTARELDAQTMATSHDNFVLEKAGFAINPNFPIIGATPDGLVSCDCCGTGVVEIKCPYSVRHSTTETYACLKGRKLKSDHAYFYQVQTQIFVTGREFADFVVWTERDIHIERIEPDVTFWGEISDQAADFHAMAIMPELVGRFFSRKDKPLPLSVQHTVSSGENCELVQQNQCVYCICQQAEDPEREMVACDNENCPYQWFHLDCMKLKLSSLPKGKWYCPECSKTRRKRRK